MPFMQLLKRRDPRIDFVRGICLCCIFLDHTFDQLILHSFAACDAADVFVFLSGISATLAYTGKLERLGWWPTAKAVLRRVRTIYLANLLLIVSIAATLMLHRRFGWQEMQDAFGWGGEPLSILGLLRLVLLIDRPKHLEILPLYIMLLGWFAVLLPMIKRPLATLALSATVWAGAHAMHPGSSVFAGNGFNPVAWQLTFMLGVLCCRHAGVLRRIPPFPLDILAYCVMAAGLAAHPLLRSGDPWMTYDQLGLPLRVLLRGSNKFDVDPGRLIALLAFAWTVWRHLGADAPWMRRNWAGILIMLGQRSLPVFTAGILLTGLGRWLLLAWHSSAIAEILVTIAGLAGMVVIAWISALWPRVIWRPGERVLIGAM
ncbi:MAG: OpgC domain-containing protein [Acetobacteraceae bacterium]|nr:OpgC domain-containing protein [Acetobacteraceae bacterium]MBV8590164.1 OpgC domain-containing protein [Acetobacteraceae bacterium]